MEHIPSSEEQSSSWTEIFEAIDLNVSRLLGEIDAAKKTSNNFSDQEIIVFNEIKNVGRKLIECRELHCIDENIVNELYVALQELTEKRNQLNFDISIINKYLQNLINKVNEALQLQQKLKKEQKLILHPFQNN